MSLLKHEKEGLQQTILSFINTLIGVPDDFQERCMIRNQFITAGMETILESLKNADGVPKYFL